MKDKNCDNGMQSYNKINFFLNGKPCEYDVAPGISTLDFLNKELFMYGTKCSCNEGDCGACTVVIASSFEGTIQYQAINSCLYPAVKLHGKHLITVEGLGTPDDLHPIQSMLLEHHGTQCGYCTPGFVMSMFALFAMHTRPNRETIMAALEGNLCRCTGYQSILDAAEELADRYTPKEIVPSWCRDIEPALFSFCGHAEVNIKSSKSIHKTDNYIVPKSVQELLELMNEYPESTIIAGGTDIMVQANIQRKRFDCLIDVGEIAELNYIRMQKDGIHIGAAVTYTQLMQSGIVKTDLPSLVQMIRLIASQQIRNFGTLAGNVANASPVGDSLPLLLVYDAILVLESLAGLRQVPIREYFVAYKQTALHRGEIIREIIVPMPPRSSIIQSIKSSKRKSVDISAVSSAIRLDIANGIVQKAYLAFGGVAATPMLSMKFAGLVQGKTLDMLKLDVVAKSVLEEFSPLSDVRGSSDYRKQMVLNHLAQYELLLKEISNG